MPELTKEELSDKIGISRGSLYYESKKEKKDLELKGQIEKVLKEHPGYGHRRIAMAFGINKKRVLRVMKKFKLFSKPRTRTHRKREDENKPPMEYPNLILNYFPSRIGEVWVSDFTYIPYEDGFIYLSTIMDLFSREVVGTNVTTKHDVNLIRGALENALNQKKPPKILHSDQGSEYCAEEYIRLAESFGIAISMSRKASPWENGYQESFYGQFKFDLGSSSPFETKSDLIAAVYKQIYVYNYQRIHTALKMPPKQYVQIHSQFNQHLSLNSPQNLYTIVSNKRGT